MNRCTAAPWPARESLPPVAPMTTRPHRRISTDNFLSEIQPVIFGEGNTFIRRQFHHSHKWCRNNRFGRKRKATLQPELFLSRMEEQTLPLL